MYNVQNLTECLVILESPASKWDEDLGHHDMNSAENAQYSTYEGTNAEIQMDVKKRKKEIHVLWLIRNTL